MKHRGLKLLLAAWTVGYFTYLIKEILIVHEWEIALSALVTGWVPAVLYSLFFVCLALLMGLVLKIAVIGRAWQANPKLALLLLLGSIAALFVSPYVGLSEDLHVGEGRRVTMLNPFVWFTSYIVILFVVAHWPENKGR